MLKIFYVITEKMAISFLQKDVFRLGNAVRETCGRSGKHRSLQAVAYCHMCLFLRV